MSATPDHSASDEGEQVPPKMQEALDQAEGAQVDAPGGGSHREEAAAGVAVEGDLAGIGREEASGGQGPVNDPNSE